MSKAKRISRASLALAALATAALGLLTACAPTPIDTDNSQSIALVEEFLADLEAGKATEAAALTAIDFDQRFIDDDFYRASAALPTNTRIVETSGYDSGGFVATVEYTLDGIDSPGTFRLQTTRDEGDEDLKIDFWGLNPEVRIAARPAAGTFTVNGQYEFVVEEENVLTLLPAAYAVEYHDPTGLLTPLGKDSEFTAYEPEIVDASGALVADGLSIAPTLMPDVEPGVYAAIKNLQAACTEEQFVGPSCPDELIENLAGPLDTSITADWFRDPAIQFEYVDGGYHASTGYKVKFSDDSLPMMEVSYSGEVTRDGSGGIAFTRP